MDREEAKQHLDRMFELEETLTAQVEAGDPWDDDMLVELLDHIRALHGANIGA